jgi:hypothetical protein
VEEVAGRDAAIAALGALRHLRREEQRFQEDTLRFLEVGLDLVTRAFAQPVSRGGALLRFQWPTQDQVVRAYHHRYGSRTAKGALRDRWPTAGEYAADLLAWALHPAQWSAHRDIADSAPATLSAYDSFSEAAALLGHQDILRLLEEPSFRIKLLMCVLSEKDEPVRDALALFYRGSLEWWSPVYAARASLAGLRLRSGVTAESLAMALTALEEGLAVRYLADAGSFRDVSHLAEVFGSAALAVMLGAVATASDERTLTQAADETFRSRP